MGFWGYFLYLKTQKLTKTPPKKHKTLSKKHKTLPKKQVILLLLTFKKRKYFFTMPSKH